MIVHVLGKVFDTDDILYFDTTRETNNDTLILPVRLRTGNELLLELHINSLFSDELPRPTRGNWHERQKARDFRKRYALQELWKMREDLATKWRQIPVKIEANVYTPEASMVERQKSEEVEKDS